MKKKTIKKIISTLFLSFLCLILLSNLAYSDTLNNSEKGINKILFFFIKKTKEINNFFVSIFNSDSIKIENEKLKEENINLKYSLEKYSQLKEENEILKNALNIEDKNNFNFILANVISRAPLNFYQGFTIDKGKEDNIFLGDIVVWNENILIGEIKELKDKSSFVRAINDKEFRVAVFVGKNKIEAVLKGGGLRPPLLEMLPSNVILNERDKIFTSGLDEKFPKGLLIGEIKKIENYQNNVFQKAEVELSFNWNDIIQVLVLSED